YCNCKIHDWVDASTVPCIYHHSHPISNIDYRILSHPSCRVTVVLKRYLTVSGLHSADPRTHPSLHYLFPERLLHLVAPSRAYEREGLKIQRKGVVNTRCRGNSERTSDLLGAEVICPSIFNAPSVS
ncbi:unnamed protein product, partial [Haemonchus placei]|uniref:Ovule protein n=1 Tax=Haemonchus placei TaxID=6290 RepID=A0A0N4WXJ2_HAEPC